ncbi:MAG: hypothetical protein NTX59_08390 [Elusimicrobia bacterium]|nr:hypothetical protein [Elusimicrobiota bacterium]
MQNTIPAEQKETAREYLRRAFSARAGQWFTMEEIKSAVDTTHGIRALCTRGDEAVLAGELINRFRSGRNYKEWSWLGHDKPEFFFYQLNGEYSPLYPNYCDLDAYVKKLLKKPKEEISIYRGSHDTPVFMLAIHLSPLDLVERDYSLCTNCHGTGRAWQLIIGKFTPDDPCLFCEGSGWSEKEKT